MAVLTQFQSVTVLTEELAPGIRDIRWWHRFHNPTLDDLIEEAAANNRDVRVARVRAELARAELQAATADPLPNIEAVGSRKRNCSARGEILDKRVICGTRKFRRLRDVT